MSPNIPTRTGPRPPHRAARAFFLTLLIFAVLAAYSTLSHPYQLPSAISIRSLDLGNVSAGVLNDDEDRCRQVHGARDQCAFVHSHCPEDEGGFSAYLDLYYCRLAGAKPLALLILAAWLGLLFSTIGIAASDFFCIDLSTIAAILGMSESMAGVTFLAFGNGSPDVFSTFAAMSTNSGSLAVGELFGAALFITSVVPASMALIRPFVVAKKTFVRDVGFFAGAAAFSMVFLWDGKLLFWECVAMVLYYIFYVAFVMTWHWWIARRRRRREKEAAARGHFVTPGEENELEEEEYRDDPDEEPSSGRLGHSRGVSWEDWTALERGDEGFGDDQNEDDEEEARDRWMSELASNMRLTRPATRSRRNTATPVRPSLVGALEFQAVLKSLQRSRNIKTIALGPRRYSDDPTFTNLQQQDRLPSPMDPVARPVYEAYITDESSDILERRSPDIHAPASARPGRVRAVSASATAVQRLGNHQQNLSPVPSVDNLVDMLENGGTRTGTRPLLDVPFWNANPSLRSPALMVEPATPGRESPISQRSGRSATHSGNLLAPPEAAPLDRPSSEYFTSRPLSRRSTGSPKVEPRAVPRARGLPKIVVPRGERSPASSRSTSPFPAYRDYPSPSGSSGAQSLIGVRPPSLNLPGPLASPESLPEDQAAEQEVPRRPTMLTRLWPHKVLPPPGVMISCLFPTIYHWHEKTWWEKLLGVVAAPSVFFLTATLPVVEREDHGGDSSPPTPAKTSGVESSHIKPSANAAVLGHNLAKGVHSEHWLGSPNHQPRALTANDGTGRMGTATVTADAGQHPHNYGAPPIGNSSQAGRVPPAEPWNRWLTILQLFLAPIFIVLSVYIQTSSDLTFSQLVMPMLICILISVVLLVPFLLTTTSTYRPRMYRIILSLAGFVVSVAWISAVASQVVGALKALAVILNMSHAIMGLTIFAVGNSLGDLVADITVAKLGYPVMALSACFGGPMLNILLGIGVSGSYMLIRGADRRHKKHPEKGIRFHSYHIEVSKTLIVTGIMLLVTLLTFLILVPLNKWAMDRKIGWLLIALWTLSTIFNVVLEVTGFLGGDIEV